MTEPYWRMERWQDAIGEWHDRWQPSPEMSYLLGLMLEMQADIEQATLARPAMVLLPADRTPAEAAAGGTLMGLPFQISDKVEKVSLVYPVSARPLTMADLAQVGT